MERSRRGTRRPRSAEGPGQTAPLPRRGEDYDAPDPPPTASRRWSFRPLRCEEGHLPFGGLSRAAVKFINVPAHGNLAVDLLKALRIPAQR
ncbi:MAG: hypothetical protein ACO2PM_16810 [Pyrobaculum sp.]